MWEYMVHLFKKRYSVALNDWMLSNPCKPVSLYSVSALVNKAFVDTFTPKDILSSFSKTGLFPFNREIFSEEDFLSSYVTDRSQSKREENNLNLSIDISINESAIQNEATISTNVEMVPPNVLRDSNIQNTSLPISLPQDVNETIISPSLVRPFPKAPPRTQLKKGRKPGRTRILTDTPEKEEIEKMLTERKKRASSVKKNVLSEGQTSEKKKKRNFYLKKEKSVMK